MTFQNWPTKKSELNKLRNKIETTFAQILETFFTWRVALSRPNGKVFTSENFEVYQIGHDSRPIKISERKFIQYFGSQVPVNQITNFEKALICLKARALIRWFNDSGYCHFGEPAIGTFLGPFTQSVVNLRPYQAAWEEVRQEVTGKRSWSSSFKREVIGNFLPPAVSTIVASNTSAFKKFKPAAAADEIGNQMGSVGNN